MVICFAEIMAGSVMFDSNYELCHVNTIAWSDILTEEGATTSYRLSDPSQPSRQCRYTVLEQHIFCAELIQKLLIL